ncbi:hypothetical protein ACS0TY_012054 [Phlomoides rotata]
MWVMKEYGVEQSWTKYANILGLDRYTDLSPLGFLPNGDLILDADKIRLIKYSFNVSKPVSLVDHDAGPDDKEYFRSEAIICADSLVSPSVLGGGRGVE